MRSLHSAAALKEPLVGRAPGYAMPRRPAAAVAVLPTARASLDGLEVSDSTWDEWVACEAQCHARLTAGARPAPPR